jgi:ferritin-like metal-binding protein YciE
LRTGLEEHLVQTKEHVSRIKEAAEILEVTPTGKSCKGMKGLIEEGAELLKMEPSVVLDAAIIGAAQRMEHYEIAAYGSLIAHAKVLEEHEVVELLAQTLKEEEEADKKLTKVADSEVNKDALETY